MNRRKTTSQSEAARKYPPALSPEAQENQMISMAMDLVKQRLLDGTASSQETTHFLRLGSTKERIEKEILEKQKMLIDAKTELIKSTRNSEELLYKAMKAFGTYQGRGEPDDE